MLFLLVLGGIVFFGCGIEDDEDPGKPPIIRVVSFYNNDSPVSGSNFNVGDTIYFTVQFADTDSDAATLHVVIYDLDDPGPIYDGPTVYELDAEQRSENRLTEQLDVAFQTGEYRVDFQMVDEKNNVSLIFRKKIYFL